MAKRLVRKGGSNGYSSSQNQKIVQVTKDQGFNNIGQMQGSTRVIYDSVPLAATTTNTTLRLFEGAKTRTFPLTNLQENKLQVGEAMTMDRFSFYITECASGTTNALGILPLQYFTTIARIYAGNLSFSIGQDQVIKKLPLSCQFASFNKDSKFWGYYTVQALAADPVTAFPFPHDVYEFQNSIVIPPIVEFYCDVTIPPISLPGGFDFYLTMKIEGLGSLYSPKANY